MKKKEFFRVRKARDGGRYVIGRDVITPKGWKKQLKSIREALRGPGYRKSKGRSLLKKRPR